MRDELIDDAGLATRIEALQAAVAALEKQIGRAGREQLKANTLAEAQAERLEATLAELRAADERREAELSAERERGRLAAQEARLDAARAMFPALDGIDEAIRAGQAMLDHAARQEPPATILRRLLGISAAERNDPTSPQAAMSAWLTGLGLVRRRLLDALAEQGVTPIAAEGRPFDPHRHIAVEVVNAPGVAPGSVVQEIRRGFLAGERVLRHAEVAVAGT